MQTLGRHLVLGTAGHIDHGKTSLVKALTGIDTDRLKEEKERGITIELGFAHLTLAGGEVVAVIDVPGHERFVRTMVAGAVGIDAVLLVVASDEGVMPQTREHLDICELLGLRGGVVALTKCDLVDGELRELGRLELKEALRGTFLKDAPIISCSARTGEGLDALRSALAEVLSRLGGAERDPEGLLRLPVDRVFAMRGFGTVVTGTLWSGRLHVGDELSPIPGPQGLGATSAKVRGLQVHGQAVSEARAGQRTAVNLALSKESVLRGDTLVRPQTLMPSQLIDVELSYLDVARERLPRRSRLLFHAVSAQRLCEVTLFDKAELRPGEHALAQVQLAEPLVLLPGDRFVLRGFSPQRNHGTTVGGGQVLRTLSQRTRRGSAALARHLDALREIAPALSALQKADVSGTATLVRLEVDRQAVRGASLSRLRMTTPLGAERLHAVLARLVDTGPLVAITDTSAGEDAIYFSRATIDEVTAALQRTLAAHHKKDPRSPGLPRETLRSQTLVARQPLPPRLFQHVIDGLIERGEVKVDKDLLRLRSHRVESDESGRALEQRLLQIYRDAGLAPPRLDEIPGAPADRRSISAASEALCRSGLLVRIKDWLFLRAHVEDLRQRLIAYLQAQREITPSAWKDLVGQSRKFSIPLAEYFDAEKVTLRVGDLRRLRGL